MKPLRWAWIVALCWSIAAHAANVHVAVAANFLAPMQQIATAFAQDTGHQAILSAGSTGKLYAQIHNGAPFDVLLSADEATPARLEKAGLALAGSRFTYATGKLVLWSAQVGLVDTQGAVLRSNLSSRIALADPQLAPYGAAALQVLTQLGQLARWQPQFVLGKDIAQTYHFIASGNAPLGFVASAQVFANGQLTSGSAWLVPTHLYTPLHQDALVLARAKDNPAALALMAYLRGTKARQIVRSFGYGP